MGDAPAAVVTAAGQQQVVAFISGNLPVVLEFQIETAAGETDVADWADGGQGRDRPVVEIDDVEAAEAIR